MIVRAVDGLGDWMFGRGINDYKFGIDAVTQNISTRLKSFLGDCFFETSAGIDWFNLLGSKNQVSLELAIRSVILNTQDVTGLVSANVNLDHETRAITIKYSVNTSLSQTTAPASSSVFLLLTEDGDLLVTESGDGIQGG